MQLVEQHLIRKSDPRYAAIDQAAFASKNLYNQATYQIRQAYIHEGTYLPYAEIFHRVKHLECYQALPRKVSNSILILIDKNWRSFKAALKAWSEHPEKFSGKRSHSSVANARNVAYIRHRMVGAFMPMSTGAIMCSAKHSPTPLGRG